MSKSRVWKKIVEINYSEPYVIATPMEWKKEYGKPTVQNLAEFVKECEDSTLPDGCNSHLGYMPIRKAIIRENACKTIITKWEREKQLTNSFHQLK